MFLPGCEPEDAGRGNRPRPAVAGPGAGGSGRLRAGRRREGSGLTEQGSKEPATPLARVRGASFSHTPPPPPPPPPAAEASATPVSAPGARQAAKPGPDGGADPTAWHRGLAPASSTRSEKLPSSHSGPRGKGSAEGKAMSAVGRTLKMSERPEPFLEKSYFPGFREVVTAPVLNLEAAVYLFQGERERGRCKN